MIIIAGWLPSFDMIRVKSFNHLGSWSVSVFVSVVCGPWSVDVLEMVDSRSLSVVWDPMPRRGEAGGGWRLEAGGWRLESKEGESAFPETHESRTTSRGVPLSHSHHLAGSLVEVGNPARRVVERRNMAMVGASSVSLISNF